MNRRCFTLGAALVLGASGLRSSDGALAAFDGEVRRRIFHADDAIAIGRRYLDQRPDKASRRVLLDDVTRGRSWRDGTPFTRHLQEWQRRDFHEGLVVVVDGWVLARTEASLCAWLALG